MVQKNQEQEFNTRVVYRKYFEPMEIEHQYNVEVIRDDDANFLSELISEETLPKTGDVDLYCSGTGTGKTSQVFGNVLNVVRASNRKILYVVHRLKILYQILERLKSEGRTIDYVDGFFCCDGIVIVLYQRLDQEFKRKKRKLCYPQHGILSQKFDVVCCDEIHMIIEDSEFCLATNTVLEDLLSHFGRTVSYIFLSATMESVEGILYEKFCGIRRWTKGTPIPAYLRRNSMINAKIPRFRKFVISQKYDNYNVRYMGNPEEIKTLYNSLPEGRKMLLFVSSKEEGLHLERELENSAFVFAENGSEKLSPKAKEEVRKIESGEKFDVKCLIATKVIDAGVNIKDATVRDIVIATEDGKDEFLQILGRCRKVDEKPLNLYIFSKDEQYFSCQYVKYKEKNGILAAIEHCNYCKRKRDEVRCKNCSRNVFANVFQTSSELSKIEGLYRIEGDDIIVNEMAKIKVKIKLDYYRDVLDKFDEYGEAGFILEQLSWMGLEDTYCKENYFSSENVPLTISDLELLLEKYIDKDMDKELQVVFRKEIEHVLVRLKLYTPRSENVIGKEKINGIFETKGIGYKVESDKVGGQVVWRIYKDCSHAIEGEGEKYDE